MTSKYLIKSDAYPFDEARKFIKRVRNADFFLFARFDIPSDEEGKVYPMHESVKVSARQMLNLINEWEAFSNRKKAAGQNGAPGVRFSVSIWDRLNGKQHYGVYLG